MGSDKGEQERERRDVVALKYINIESDGEIQEVKSAC